ncbi:MAG: hypothetical protein M3467_11705 [Actinomycetota bacterium]|nr:hypothetical protein [Actinomycetota bacterium]
MTWCYSAFGLGLRSDLPLPGMVPADLRGPTVSLRLSDPDEVARAWPGTERELVGTMPDGCRCVGELAPSGERRLTYGDRAVYLLSADTMTILCAPGDVEELSWQRFLLDAVLLKVSEAHGLHALHASAVEGPDGVLAFATSSGGGKSSLAAELVRRGHAFFTDDALTMDREDGHVRAHPAPPLMNFPLPHPEGFPATDLGVVQATFGAEAWVAVRNAASTPRRVASIHLLDRHPGLRPGLDLLPASPVHLLPHALTGGGSPASATRRFELLADLAADAAIYRLRADPEIDVAQLADLVEDAL